MEIHGTRCGDAEGEKAAGSSNMIGDGSLWEGTSSYKYRVTFSTSDITGISLSEFCTP
jgi:hypothetical protein